MRALTRITQLLLRFSLYGRSSSIRIHGWITEEFGNSCCTTKLSFSSASTTEKWCQEKQEEITNTRSTKIISWRSGPQKDNRTLLALIKPHCRQFIMKHGDSCSRSETHTWRLSFAFCPHMNRNPKQDVWRVCVSDVKGHRNFPTLIHGSPEAGKVWESHLHGLPGGSKSHPQSLA